MTKKIPNFQRHPPVCFRLSSEEKERFKAAAATDGKALGTWLKHLARQRIAEQDMHGTADSRQAE